MRVHPPPFLQASRHWDCLSSSTRYQEWQQDSFCVFRGGSGWPLLQQNQKQRPAQYSQVLERDHLSRAHKNAWNSYSHSSRVKLWAKFTCGSLALATVHYTKWKLKTVTKQTDPRCPQWQLSTLFLQLSFYLAEILVGIAEELMF